MGELDIGQSPVAVPGRGRAQAPEKAIYRICRHRASWRGEERHRNLQSYSKATQRGSRRPGVTVFELAQGCCGDRASFARKLHLVIATQFACYPQPRAVKQGSDVRCIYLTIACVRHFGHHPSAVGVILRARSLTSAS